MEKSTRQIHVNLNEILINKLLQKIKNIVSPLQEIFNKEQQKMEIIINKILYTKKYNSTKNKKLQNKSINSASYTNIYKTIAYF